MTDPPPEGSAPLFVPTVGRLDLDPLHPSYLALADGLGLFGPPDPAAVIDAAGLGQVTVTFPPPSIPLGFVVQHFTLTTFSPNGIVQIGAPVPLTAF